MRYYNCPKTNVLVKLSYFEPDSPPIEEVNSLNYHVQQTSGVEHPYIAGWLKSAPRALRLLR